MIELGVNIDHVATIRQARRTYEPDPCWAAVEAHLGGTMAYVTVDFDVEETSVTRDASGNVIDGNPDRVFSVEDIWTFTRDTRASDPNWTLIETRAAEK